MMEYRYFKKEGNIYIMKRQYGFATVIVIGLSLLAFSGIVSDNLTLFYICGILALLCAISVFTEKLEIDLDHRTIIIKRGLIKSGDHIKIEDIQNFELTRLIYIFIPVNTSLNMIYFDGSQQKVGMVAQGFSSKSMQIVLNEIEEILESSGHRR
ncbi:hypothetical protein OF897_21245 [Chryseobacterium formosus]|uniref:DUF304 domain-containing protein n=1 Tax=Chryseobacterium formosus TaxID=1537363 RepID=A0ABT3XXW3_9FLAO|nr:hypothetical protein [Chryseobacterium formosus]MCX8526447.1 hypothetical protein [Chryseobacterium formosus]